LLNYGKEFIFLQQMKKNEILKHLHSIKFPITSQGVVGDEHCEFSLLTNQGHYKCFSYGPFPLNGPFRWSSAQKLDFSQILLSNKKDWEEELEKNIRHEYRKNFLKRKIDVLGIDSIHMLLREKNYEGRIFYIFHDFNNGESLMFKTLKNAYEYFVKFFKENVFSEFEAWDKMDKESLINFYELYVSFKKDSPKKYINKEWLGAYYNPYTGFCGRYGSE